MVPRPTPPESVRPPKDAISSRRDLAEETIDIGGEEEAEKPARVGDVVVIDDRQQALSGFESDTRKNEASLQQLQPSTTSLSTLANIEEVNEEEEEGEVEVPFKEHVKSAAAFFLVVGVFAFLAGGLPSFGLDFEEPACEVPAERSCKPCGKGTMILPLFGEWEKSWPDWPRATLYFVGLFWAFMGVGIVCDQFMAAIEAITSSESTVWVEVHSGARRKFRVKNWNATIANLSLMALGSSAPEILLSATELGANKFFAGKLGPSTIVGSAAFNLLVITAVCISAIPAPEVRKIEGTDVFCVTTTVSIFAYLWLLIILLAVSPDRVELWESLLTLTMFPTLLLIAFAADKGYLARLLGGCLVIPTQSTLREEAFKERSRQIQARYGKELPAQAVKMIMEQEIASEKAIVSKAQLRKNITASFTAGGRLDRTSSMSDEMLTANTKSKSSRTLILGFKEERYVVLECAGVLALKVVANREPGMQVDLQYFTVEGTAKRDLRYRHVEGVVSFGPRQREAVINVPIIDNDSWDPDEEFYVMLSEAVPAQTGPRRSTNHVLRQTILGSRTLSRQLDVKLGQQSATVTVLNDDIPGTLSFDADEIQASPGATATISVVRSGGSSGRIQCQYETVDDSAVSSKDYKGIEGTLVFEDGEVHKAILCDINGKSDQDNTEEISFKLLLHQASPGVKFDANTDGGEDKAICDVIIQADKEPPLARRWLCRHFDSERLTMGMDEWLAQFVAAFYCNGSPEDQMGAGPMDWFFHAVTLFWKLLFAFVPPPIFANGWVCFFCALFMIGVVTAFVGEIASLLGCTMGMADEVTAITLVALGTSLPDTFASKAAAQQDDTADNSVGNVMGSNSVNVFLGLGISWTIGALYWGDQGMPDLWLNWRSDGKTYKELFVDSGRYPEGGFMVPAGTLLFSVCVYTGCAICCVALLVLRRYRYGGELGGPRSAQIRDSLFLVFLWVAYVVASSIYAQGT